jgi:hypothetical protein
MAKLMMLVGAKWREFIAGGHQVTFTFLSRSYNLDSEFSLF